MGKAIFFKAKPMFGLDYTERQLAILNDEVPIEQIRTTELVAIMKKANERADAFNFDIAQGFYYKKKDPDAFVPGYTIEQSKAILQSLTPWQIDWNPKIK